jgi:SHS2 domain-containing protein
MKDFELLEHTADIGVIAYGDNLKQLFANAARGLFSLIINLESISDSVKRKVRVTALNREGLLFEWLNELIYLFDRYNIVFNKFEIIRISDTELQAIVYGEKVNPSRHSIKQGVKAATYHMLKIEDNNGFKAQVLFDI